jgi:hypothetical protein
VGFAHLPSRKSDSQKCHYEIEAHRFNAFADQNTFLLLQPPAAPPPTPSFSHPLPCHPLLLLPPCVAPPPCATPASSSRRRPSSLPRVSSSSVRVRRDGHDQSSMRRQRADSIQSEARRGSDRGAHPSHLRRWADLCEQGRQRSSPACGGGGRPRDH